jgi:hypothetical protein
MININVVNKNIMETVQTSVNRVEHHYSLSHRIAFSVFGCADGGGERCEWGRLKRRKSEKSEQARRKPIRLCDVLCCCLYKLTNIFRTSHEDSLSVDSFERFFYPPLDARLCVRRKKLLKNVLLWNRKIYDVGVSNVFLMLFSSLFG